MTPPHIHINFDASFNAGMPPIWTVGDPGIQGAVVMGTQGIGVSTPKAAAVAAATVGFATLWHIANGRILTMGLLSMMFASGVLVMTRLTGRTTSELGAIPKLHLSNAPMQTCLAMFDT